MSSITIIRDTREQKPYEFANHSVDVEDATLRTGDYTLARFCDRDEKNDTYVPRFAVERKTGHDFLNSITSDRKRFKREIERANEWELDLEIVVEEPYTNFTNSIGVMGSRDIHPNQVTGTVREWTREYNVNFHFAGYRSNGENYTHDTLLSWKQYADRNDG